MDDDLLEKLQEVWWEYSQLSGTDSKPARRKQHQSREHPTPANTVVLGHDNWISHRAKVGILCLVLGGCSFGAYKVSCAAVNGCIAASDYVEGKTRYRGKKGIEGIVAAYEQYWLGGFTPLPRVPGDYASAAAAANEIEYTLADVELFAKHLRDNYTKKKINLETGSFISAFINKVIKDGDTVTLTFGQVGSSINHVGEKLEKGTIKADYLGFATGQAAKGGVIQAQSIESFGFSGALPPGSEVRIYEGNVQVWPEVKSANVEPAAAPSNNLTMRTLRHVGEFYLGVDDGNPETKPFGETLTGKTLKKVFSLGN